MGKWNYRRRWTPKNYYRDQRIPSPPTYYDTEYKLRGAWKNVELPWEERFCISVGIPWEKIVNAKEYMNCYDNVVNWNDSAGEATFTEAKKRFWAKINEIPAEDPQPSSDPDMYNQDIDWNPEIDLELVKALDRAYFNPDTQKVETFDGIKSNNDGFVPGCILGLDEMNKGSENPWERSKTDKSNGWECFNNSVNKNIDPWEQGITQDDREIKDRGWGGGGDGGGAGSWHKDITWGGGANKSWQRVDDISKNPWGGGANKSWQRDDAYAGTSRGTQRGNYRGNYFGRGQHDRPNNVGHQRHNGSGWDSSVGCRKREGSQQYTSSYKSARVQYDDYRAGGNQYRR